MTHKGFQMTSSKNVMQRLNKKASKIRQTNELNACYSFHILSIIGEPYSVIARWTQCLRTHFTAIFEQNMLGLAVIFTANFYSMSLTRLADIFISFAVAFRAV